MSNHTRHLSAAIGLISIAAAGILLAGCGGGSVGPQGASNAAQLTSVVPEPTPIQVPICHGCGHRILPL